MAILRKGILDGFTGNMDGLTGQKRSGHSTISQRREGQTTNWSVQTDNERTKMAYLRVMWQTMNVSTVSRMYNYNPKGYSKFMLFVKANYDHVTTNSFTPHPLFEGRGNLGTAVALPQFSYYRTNGNFNMEWRVPPLQPYAATNDRTRFYIWVPSQNRFIFNTSANTRNQGRVLSTSGALPLGTPVVFMLSFASQTNGRQTKWFIQNIIVTNP